MAKLGPHSEEEYLTVAEVARLLRVSEDWVYERAKSGELPSFKLPGGLRRFRWSEVVATLEERFREGGSVPRARVA